MCVTTWAQSYVTIPSRIQIENNTNTNVASGSTTSDVDGGLEYGWLNTGAWAEFSVSVPTSGIYLLNLRVTNGFSDNATVGISSSGNSIASIPIPRTGGMSSWKTVPTLVVLPAGNQTLRLDVTQGVISLNWFECIKNPLDITSQIEAEDFAVAGNIGTESTADTGGGLNVSNIDDDDWMDYHVNAASSNVYTFSFRVANAYGYGEIELMNSSSQVLGSVNVPQTGGWQNWQTIQTTANLPAGEQVLRIHAKRGAFNLNWFSAVEGQVEKDSSFISFDPLPMRTVDGGYFVLSASSNNTESPIEFSSSNSSVVEIQQYGTEFRAVPVAAGQAIITAKQSASLHYHAADDVSQVQDIEVVVIPDYDQIPIEGSRWYILNNSDKNLEALFDGVTNANVPLTPGMILPRYDAYYPLKDGESMTISMIKMFDYEGNFSANPMVLSVITQNWERVPIATFTGSVYNGWVGPDPEDQSSGQAKFLMDETVSDVRYLVISSAGGLPTEMELYGTYSPAGGPGYTSQSRTVKLGDMLGVNAYEWNFQDGETPWQINSAKMDMVESFSGIRHYIDWQKLESEEGVYSYNPTLSGGWHYDQIYEECQAAGIEVLACIKTLPDWLLDTYPASEQDRENVPTAYGRDFSDPNSYIEQAKLAFQFAARYGSNANVDPNLLSVHDTPRWPGDNPNTLRIGTDLIKYMECDNERDKWWKGRKAYQTAREYCANLSAFYDGHKNTMGAGVGVKNADPNMKVVLAGLVSGPEYVQGMIDWCKEFRGYKANGEVNICWDVINYHIYTDNSPQADASNLRGAAPEVTNAAQKAQAFVQIADEYCEGMPVWITETGYDVHQDSPMKAISIGSKSVLDTQADWILRSALLSARNGIGKVFFYQMYDDNESGMIFSTSGLVNSDLTRRPAADFLWQTKKQFGDYIYEQTISSDPIVDVYDNNGEKIYVLMVPDEVGRTANYSLNLTGVQSAYQYVPTAGQAQMQESVLNSSSGQFNIVVGETPIFIKPNTSSGARKGGSTTTSVGKYEESQIFGINFGVNLFPNPVADVAHIEVVSNSDERMKVHIFSASTGALYYDAEVETTAIEVNVDKFPSGLYIVDILQGESRAMQKMVINK
ncbi:carbohydrate-binding protein [Marinilongibacter aquaticus]|uniref:carbohydrate-binding protein n=1 Tax=Marinilongibacter aquaticus TaxID=2975157 RepID=UPI0021BDD2FF|nr:carbohydrate-binding protein [Marinilongibacter aquaticus]UBM60721.1 carbohydrate-binding protein [Marinilongibacter aquaticus]